MDDCGLMNPARLVHMLSDRLFDNLLYQLRDEHGTSLETAISAAASLAGVTLLRASGIDLAQHVPGSPVRVEIVDIKIRELVEYMDQASVTMGLTPDRNWEGEIPEINQPLRPVEDLVAACEKPYLELVNSIPTSVELKVKAAALAAVKLARAGSNLVSPKISKAIIYHALVTASTTAPSLIPS